MKVNIFLTTLSVMLALLIGYLAFNIAEGKENDILCGIGSFICLTATLVPIIGLRYESSRLGTNIRVFSSLFFLIFLISNCCFAGFGINLPYYIITHGILLIIFLALLYELQNIKSI